MQHVLPQHAVNQHVSPVSQCFLHVEVLHVEVVHAALHLACRAVTLTGAVARAVHPDRLDNAALFLSALQYTGANEFATGCS